jgi:ABC-type oligopeptide transport system, periplasmic component
MKKIGKNLIITMSSILLATGCTQGVTNTKDDKILNVAITRSLTTLNQQNTVMKDESEQILQFMEGLVRYDKDGFLQPAGAENINVAADGLTYTFQLRKSACWQDGTPITADDYVYTFKILVENKLSKFVQYADFFLNGRKVYEGILPVEELGVKALDEYTLQIELEKPLLPFLSLLSTTTYFPVNKTLLNAVGGIENYGISVDSIIANGPFIVKEYEIDKVLVLEKNENYWDKDNVKLAGVIINTVPELSTQSALFNSGEIDILKITGDLANGYIDDENTITITANQQLFMYLSGTTNAPNKLLANKNFRKAVALAIDKTILTTNITKDGSIPLEGLFTTGAMDVNGTDYRKYVGTYDEPIFDITKAREYLELAKVELGDTPLTFKLAVQQSEPYMSVFQNIKAQIEANLLEVTVELDTYASQLYYPKLEEYRTPAGMYTWSVGLEDLYYYAQIFETGSFFNYYLYSNEEYDTLIQQARYETDIEKQAQIYSAAEDIVVDDAVFIPLYQMGQKYKYQDRIKELKINSRTAIFDYKNVEIE